MLSNSEVKLQLNLTCLSSDSLFGWALMWEPGGFGVSDMLSVSHLRLSFDSCHCCAGSHRGSCRTQARVLWQATLVILV